MFGADPGTFVLPPIPDMTISYPDGHGGVTTISSRTAAPGGIPGMPPPGQQLPAKPAPMKPWVPIAIGGMVLAAVAAVALIKRRRRA